jgi:hypothetical protein
VAVAVLAAIDAIVSRRNLNPVRLMGYVFILFALLTPALWDGVKGLSGSGVPPNLEYGSSKSFEIACLTVAAGLLLTSLTFELISIKKNNISRAPTLKGFKVIPWPASFSLVALWVLGQGPSLLDKTIYLGSDGLSFLTRPTALLAPILATAIFAAELVATKRLTRPSIVIACCWIALLASVGSRLAIFPLLLVLFGFLFKFFVSSKSALAKSLFFLAWAYVTSWLTLTLFFVSLVSRGQRHGLLNIPKLLDSKDTPSLIFGHEWLSIYQSLLVSLTSIFPIVNISANTPMDPDIILRNANPLPADLLSLSSDISSELILPWLPKALLGQMLGTFGVFGLLLLVVILSTITLLAYRYSVNSDRNLVAIFIGAAFSLSLLSGLQYPSRISFRFFSPIYLAIIFLFLSSSRAWMSSKTSAKTREGLPEMALEEKRPQINSTVVLRE